MYTAALLPSTEHPVGTNPSGRHCRPVRGSAAHLFPLPDLFGDRWHSRRRRFLCGSVLASGARLVLGEIKRIHDSLLPYRGLGEFVLVFEGDPDIAAEFLAFALVPLNIYNKNYYCKLLKALCLLKSFTVAWSAYSW